MSVPQSTTDRWQRSRRPGRVIPIAWRNLTEFKGRLAGSVAGAAFAVVLMLVENGFRNALLDNMVAVIRSIDGDLFLTNRERYMISEPVPFPRGRLELARGAPGVAEAHPFYLVTEGESLWRNPLNGLSRPIRLLGFEPRSDVLRLAEVRDQRLAWERPDTALADERSKVRFYGGLDPGIESEVNGRRVRIAGRFALGTDFRSNGTLIMSEQNLLRYCPRRAAAPWALTPIDLGILRVEPGADLVRVKAAVARRIPADLTVLTKVELLRKEQDFWENATPIGVVFDIGVAMGFIVGLAICYQVLFAEIAGRLPQFATLMAMGYTDWALLRIVLRESLYLALFGFTVGLAISHWLFGWLQGETGLSMVLKPVDVAVVLILTVALCMLAGVLAARRLLRLDPAALFD
ncbi:MAG: FtsX-like permease family protein [Isosphaeraceae bacterium]|nr:FtsX-like permease family protein [Isosphaeraceae bacterium]